MVYFPSRFVSKISVSLSTRVGDLRKLMRLGPCELVCQGQVLADSQTLRFYNMKERDTIVVISGVPSEHEIERWLVVTSDTEAFHDRMQFMVNEKTAREAARMHDVLMTKIERKPRTFRRVCAAVANRSADCEVRTTEVTVNYGKAEEPSSRPLPVHWPVEEIAKASVPTREETLVEDKEQPEPTVKPYGTVDVSKC